MNESKFYHIQSKFVLTKVIMFCYHGSRCTLMTYAILFLTSFGLNPQQAGIISGIRSAVEVIGGIFLGWLLDYTKKKKIIFIIAILIIVLSVMSMPFIGYFTTNSNGLNQSQTTMPFIGYLTTNSNGLNQSQTTKMLMEKQTLNISTSNETVSMSWQKRFSSKNSTLFLLLLTSFLIYGLSNGIHGLIDGCIMSYVNYHGKGKTNYSFQRLWASIGYGVVPVITGLFLDVYKNDIFSIYMPVFYVFVFLQLVLFFSICTTFSNNETDDKERRADELLERKPGSQQSEEKSVLVSFFVSLWKIDTILIIFSSFLNGMAGYVQWSFIFLLMAEGMTNASKTIMGMSFVAASFIEAFIAPSIKKVTGKLGNSFIGISISLFGYFLTFLLYYYVNDGITFFFVNMIAGLTYPFYLYTTQEELYKLSSINCRSMMFTVDRGVHGGLGGGVGGVVAGSIYNAYGGRIMYLSFAMFYAVFAVLTLFYGIYKIILSRKAKKLSLVTNV